MTHFIKGTRVITDSGERGEVAYVRFSQTARDILGREVPEAYSILRDSQLGRAGYEGSVYPADQVHELFKCAEPSCPGFPYKASERWHPCMDLQERGTTGSFREPWGAT